MNTTQRRLLIGSAITASIACAAQVQAQDAPIGKALHDSHCIACHGSEVYTRPNHRVTNMDALNTQVTRCENNLGLQWFDEQRDAVSNYLNDSYYHF